MTFDFPVGADLSGKDGKDGEDARHGYQPDCGLQGDRVNHDINAPNGGNGGDGGNGSSLTVYYTNLGDLRNIFVQSPGKEGGRGGRGGNGTVGYNNELVTRDYNRFTLTLGKLKIPNESLRPGVNVDIEVITTRSLRGRSTKQTISWQGVIRKPR